MYYASTFIKKLALVTFTVSLLILSSFLLVPSAEEKWFHVDILSYEVDPAHQELKFYWRDATGHHYKDFKTLRSALKKENKELVFAMNGGMYHKDLTPQGLYIEDGITKAPMDTITSGYGNFYLQPNGIFYLTNNNEPRVCTTTSFKSNGNIKYATQSGPMLLIDGEYHPALKEGSTNLHIRNGVGVLPNGHLLFAMSKEKINFYDFATFFKQQGCRNALYLDGFVSRAYLPAKSWSQLDGNFGVIIAETKK